MPPPLSVITGVAVLVVVLVFGVNRLLLWMDEHDWIVIPNREAAQSLEQRMMRGLVEVQSIAEPGKRHLLKALDKRRREDEDTRTPDPPQPGAAAD